MTLSLDRPSADSFSRIMITTVANGMRPNTVLATASATEYPTYPILAGQTVFDIPRQSTVWNLSP
jgi:hypothetical protein